MNQTNRLQPLPPEQLRWQCDVDRLGFESTLSVDPTMGVVGQPTAREALEFGLQCLVPGQNIYVRGQPGTGRRRLVQEMIQRLNPACDSLNDYCYVHHFDQRDRPRLITLPASTAHDFRDSVLDFVKYLEEGLAKDLDSETHVRDREKVQQAARDEIDRLTSPLERSLKDDQLALVSVGEGPAAHTVILPVVDGEPISPDQLEQLVAEEKVPASVLENFRAKLPDYQKQLQQTQRQVSDRIKRVGSEIRSKTEQVVRQLSQKWTDPITERFPAAAVRAFLGDVVNDVAETVLRRTEGDQSGMDFQQRYGVNIVLCRDDPSARPVIEESTPSLISLLGTVEPDWGPGGAVVSDYRGIRAGALLKADGGYLILDVNDVLSEPGAWRALTRTLRTGKLEIVPPEAGFLSRHVMTQPEPIPIQVRVILIGDVQTFYQLDHADPDFDELFKVLADFDSQLDRNSTGIDHYAHAIAQLVREESLPHFSAGAVAALAEHGSRIASSFGKLTARFGRIADLAREAAFLAMSDQTDLVQAEHVKEAVRRTKARASMPSVKFQELVESGKILVQTSGEVVGQINGLAVMSAGPLTYGFPARITATIGPGNAGLINIEGQSRMSGSIHTKGFHILGGLLRHLLQTDHPLSFSASLAFEQSYGGIDGDSASGAEIVCLLSALTGIPIKQGMAMTGAIDQHGHVEAIGGVNEKIEGFFDACQHSGLSGQQGVVIPLANAGDLMLRQDVVDACRDGKFSVFGVDQIFDALELMTGIVAGDVQTDGSYPADTLLARALQKANQYWKRSNTGPLGAANKPIDSR